MLPSPLVVCEASLVGLLGVVFVAVDVVVVAAAAVVDSFCS